MDTYPVRFCLQNQLRYLSAPICKGDLSIPVSYCRCAYAPIHFTTVDVYTDIDLLLGVYYVISHHSESTCLYYIDLKNIYLNRA